MTAPLAYDAAVLLGFGGPEGVDEVVPFLERVTTGRGIPKERLVEVGQHYFTLGGVSPINAQNRALRSALQEALAAHGIEIELVLANRNSPPFVADVLADLAGRGHRRLLALATAAYSGYSSCRQYREDLGIALEATGLDLDVRKLGPFYDLPASLRRSPSNCGLPACRPRPGRGQHAAGVHYPSIPSSRPARPALPGTATSASTAGWLSGWRKGSPRPSE